MSKKIPLQSGGTNSKGECYSHEKRYRNNETCIVCSLFAQHLNDNEMHYACVVSLVLVCCQFVLGYPLCGKFLLSVYSVGRSPLLQAASVGSFRWAALRHFAPPAITYATKSSTLDVALSSCEQSPNASALCAA
ncbi:hypothetical protein WOC13_21995, partial [Vibrio parahaemolyticus]